MINVVNKHLVGFMFGMLILLQKTYAQGVQQLWTRATLQYPIQNSDWRLDHEFQHRRPDKLAYRLQETPPILNSYRMWLHHQTSSAWRISASPFAFFSNHNPTSSKEKNSEEIRQTFAFQYTISSKNVIKLYNRNAVEWRYFTASKSTSLRTRIRIGAQYKFNAKLQLHTNAEMLVHAQPSNWNTNQYRAQTNLEGRISEKISIELGYMKIWLPASETSNIALVNLNYKI